MRPLRNHDPLVTLRCAPFRGAQSFRRSLLLHVPTKILTPPSPSPLPSTRDSKARRASRCPTPRAALKRRWSRRANRERVRSKASHADRPATAAEAFFPIAERAAPGFQCGATNAPSMCVLAPAVSADGGTCVPKTCADYLADGIDCGVQSNGCGGMTPNCGTCAAPAFCGGGGPSTCAISGGGVCTPKTCADYPGKCGPQSNGCGGVTTDCGGCPTGQICGGSGVPDRCGGPTCTPLTCEGQQAECGIVPDGCGRTLICPECPPGKTCGGGGLANRCGTSSCTPLTGVVRYEPTAYLTANANGRCDVSQPR